MRKLVPLPSTISKQHRSETLYNELQRQILNYESFAGRNATSFSKFYYVFRPATLALAIVTTVASTLIGQRNIVVTILAGLVALVTALDSWLKPQVKWKLHDEANDTFSSILRKLTLVGRDNLKALEELEIEFSQLVERYRNARLLE